MMTESDDAKRTFYVYEHMDPGTDEVFYVGMGEGNRAHSHERRGSAWREFVADLDEPFSVRVVANELTYGEACRLEREKIAVYGKRCEGAGCLVNRTDGRTAGRGEAPSPQIGWSVKFEGEGEAMREYASLSAKERKAKRGEWEAEGAALRAKVASLPVELDDCDLLWDLNNALAVVLEDLPEWERRRVSTRDYFSMIEGELDSIESGLADFDDFATTANADGLYASEELDSVVEVAEETIVYLKQILAAATEGDGADRG